MKIAIIHDFLHQLGGAERVLESLHDLYPEAPVYTLIYDRSKMPYQDWDIRPHPLVSRLPFKRFYTLYWPVFPFLVENFRLPDCDVVLSSSYAWVKGVKTKALHICYCYTPPRFLYEMFDEYVRRYPGWLRRLIFRQKERLKRWDQEIAARPDYYLAISRHVARRIKEYYGRDSEVVYPPVKTDFFTPAAEPAEPGKYYLVVSRLATYKRIDLAVEAFNSLGWPLVIIGRGAEEKRLKKLAKDNITFLGQMNDSALCSYYRHSRALIFPGEEDFGIVPVEAQACGKPVLAFRRGGALETVIEGETGSFFDQQEPAELAAAVKRLAGMKFDPAACRANSLKFSRDIFQQKIGVFVEEKFRLFQAGQKKV